MQQSDRPTRPIQAGPELCQCGKPAVHVNAPDDRPEWACRVPQGSTVMTSKYDPFAGEELPDISAELYVRLEFEAFEIRMTPTAADAMAQTLIAAAARVRTGTVR